MGFVGGEYSSGMVGKEGTPSSPGRELRDARFEMLNLRAIERETEWVDLIELGRGEVARGRAGDEVLYLMGEEGTEGGSEWRSGLEAAILDAYRAFEASEPVNKDDMRLFQRRLMVESASEVVLRLLIARVSGTSSATAEEGKSGRSDSATRTWSRSIPSCEASCATVAGWRSERKNEGHWSHARSSSESR